MDVGAMTLVLMHKIPHSLRSHLQGYEWHPVAIGESRATVHRLSASGRPALFLKSQRRELLFGLQGEAERLRWLHGRAPVPVLVDFVADQTHDHLLMEALTGEDAATVKMDPGSLVVLLAEALRGLHAFDIANCPFRHAADDLINRASAILAAGQVDEGNFDPQTWDGRHPKSFRKCWPDVRPRKTGFSLMAIYVCRT